jgi:FMN phosphatase YigB (HAD superfamily)
MDKRFTHVIFDLGGVLIGLDPGRTLRALQNLAPHADVDWKELYHHPLALKYEKGLVGDDEFREGLREVLETDQPDEEIDAAWNAMILDFPSDRFSLLEELSRKYKVLLLSNTNDIHLRYVQHKVNALGYESLDQHFTRAHYSHHMKMRKPDKEIYEKVLSEHGLAPGEAFFIDDNPANIESAAMLGIGTHHLTHLDSLTNFVKSAFL